MYYTKVPYNSSPGDVAQLECLKRATVKGRRGFGVFFQQRVGKTRIAIDAAGISISEGCKRVLIVAPVCAQAGWQDQIKQYLGKTGYKVKVGTAKVSSHKLPTIDDPVIILTTYGKMVEGSKEYTAWKPDVVILDDVHLIKNRTSERSKVAWYVSRHAKRVLGLTGTPYSNKSYQDLFGIFRAVSPELLGTKWSSFEKKYCVKGGYMGYEVVGYQHEEEMLRIVDANSMRVLRKDVMDEPEAEDIQVIVEMVEQERKYYTQMQKESVIFLEGEPRVTADMVTTQRTKLQQITSGSVKDDEGKQVRVGDSKLKMLIDLVNNLLEEDKDTRIVISCRYIEDVSRLHNHLSGSAVYIIGVMSSNTRKQAVDFWINDKKARVLIIQEQTMSMGVDLSIAHHMIFYSWGEDSITHSQVRDRLMGRFQKSPVVHYHYMICRKTIDELMYRNLKGKITKAEMAANWRRYLIP